MVVKHIQKSIFQKYESNNSLVPFRNTNVRLTLSQTEKYKAMVVKHIHKPILQKYESNNSLVPFLKN